MFQFVFIHYEVDCLVRATLQNSEVKQSHKQKQLLQRRTSNGRLWNARWQQTYKVKYVSCLR